jgi:alkyl sulfatase BDS1-like metallo-beta-lactamase superfamily hydrolase
MKTSELFEICKEKAETARVNLPAGFNAVALVDITGSDPARWRLSAADGRLGLAESALEDQADITVTLDTETAAGLYLKTIKPLAAFFTGKLKVKGDPSKIAFIKELLTKGKDPKP